MQSREGSQKLAEEISHELQKYPLTKIGFSFRSKVGDCLAGMFYLYDIQAGPIEEITKVSRRLCELCCAIMLGIDKNWPAPVANLLAEMSLRIANIIPVSENKELQSYRHAIEHYSVIAHDPSRNSLAA